jgi:SHS2 domain-containing protein
MAFSSFQVRIEGEPPKVSGLSATVQGEPLDLTRHEIEVEVKAITWHALKVEQTANGWLAEVIVDV